MIKFKEIIFLNRISGIAKGKIYKNYWDILSDAVDLDDLFSKMQKKSNVSDKILMMAREDAEEFYEKIINSDIHVVTVFDKEYPQKLMDMGNDRPLILYIKGDVEALTKPNIAIIGTRKPSQYSKIFEENLVKSILTNSDRVVVSGLALGCDKIAHEVTVNENRPTIAILPSGVNVIKPAKNKGLAEDILKTGGCLVSEYLPDEKPNKGSYVQRDSIVAAFSDATFVVECGIKSGTMHTVNAANDYQRQIYAFLPDERPEGSYDGNEFILNENYNATRVEDIGEFIDDLKILRNKKTKKSTVTNLDDFK